MPWNLRLQFSTLSGTYYRVYHCPNWQILQSHILSFIKSEALVEIQITRVLP